MQKRAALVVLLVCSFLPSTPGEAAQARKQGFVQVSSGKSLYVDWIPAMPGRPTLVVLNGLTYKVESWDAMMPELAKTGSGILRFDPAGQGRTLLKFAPVRQEIPIGDQVADLASLLDRLGLRQPVTLLGLSYGGGWAVAFAAAHPQRVRSIILMAPFVAPIPTQDTWIRGQIAATRIAFPFNPATDDELYDYFLRVLVYTTFPMAEPVILENPYKLEATFRLVQGIRKVIASELLRFLPKHSVHLMVAQNDQYVPRAQLDEFWAQLPVDIKMSRMNVARSEHKLAEAVPNFSAGWVNQILAGDPRLSGGRVFEGDPGTGEARSGSSRIALPRN